MTEPHHAHAKGDRRDTSARIRPWTPRDFPAVQRVLWETWMDTYAPFIPVQELKNYFDEHYNLKAIAELALHPDIEGYVAEDKEEVTGYMLLKYSEETGMFSVASLYILPTKQGGGLGGRMLALAEQRAKEEGHATLWLGVMTQNTRAIDWYAARGFAVARQEPFSMGNVSVPHYIMSKTIQ